MAIFEQCFADNEAINSVCETSFMNSCVKGIVKQFNRWQFLLKFLWFECQYLDWDEGDSECDK